MVMPIKMKTRRTFGILLCLFLPAICIARIPESDMELALLGKKEVTLERYKKDQSKSPSLISRENASSFRGKALQEKVVETFTERDGRRRNLLQTETNCTLWRVEVRYDGYEQGHWECEFTDPSFLEAVSPKTRDFRIVGPGIEDFLSTYAGESGKTTLTLSSGVEVVSGVQELRLEPDQIVNIADMIEDSPSFRRGRGLANSLGDLRTLVIRVNAKDASPPSASALSSDIFFDNYCLRTQYSRCSFGALNIDPAQNLPVASSAMGVVDIEIDLNAKGNSKEKLQDNARAVAREIFDVSISEELESQFDLVMFCMPPGTGSWVAYAFIGRWDSYYNDFWCQSLSAQMHEVGHNLGLHHSGILSNDQLASIYGDTSGMMGFSFNADDLPEQCFNAAKNWQLGWYDDKRLDLNARLELRSGPRNYILNGLVDYDNGKTNRYVVIKIGDYYIGWNKRADFNVGTQNARDQVTVHLKQGSPYSSSESKLVGKLDLNGEYFIPGENVRVKYIRNDGSEDAVIELSLVGENVDLCDGELELVLNTDQRPQDSIWGILNPANEILYVSDGYTQTSRTYTEKVYGLCENTEYIFVILDRSNNGICCSEGQGSYVGKSRGEVLFSGGDFFDREEQLFRLSSVLDPSETDPPTVSPVTPPTAPPTLSPTIKPPTAPPTLSPTTKPPTASPIAFPPPTASPITVLNPDCTDNPDFKWKRRKNRTCKWLSKRRKKKKKNICKKKRKFREECKETCQVCEISIR